MAKQNKIRVAAGLVGATALIAGAVLPGSLASAENSGEVKTDVTRAVLIQGDADANISRATLITQINAEGSGSTSFTVPVAAGSDPKNMDTFGGPTVTDGSAQYNLTVDGTQTIRTSQNYDPAEIPITVSVEATLDGQPMKLSELSGKSGLAKVTYTFVNTTAEPTQLTYKDALGNTITEEADIPVPMAGSVNISYPGSWGDVSAPTATTVSGDGTGNTLVSGTVPLLPSTLPNQDTTGHFEIEARLSDAVVPPADIKFAVIPPDKTPDLQDGRNTAETGAEQAGAITEAGTKLGEGALKLQDGLATAADGAKQIADGVAGKLGPGVSQLSEGLTTFNDVAISKLTESASTLPETVRSDPSFSELTDGFDSMNSAIDGVEEGLGVYKTKSSEKPGPWVANNGDIDSARADVARTLWGLVYGARSIDIPTDAKNKNTVPNENNGGLTNPLCDFDDPESATNPCGAWQVVEVVKQNLDKLGGGLKQISDTLADPKAGGAFAIKSLANTLGCQTSQPAGSTGPVVGPAVGFTGNPCSEPITVGGSASCTNPFQDKLPVAALPCNLIVNAVLGGVDLKAPLPEVQLGGLSQSLFNPLKLTNTNPPTPTEDSGLVAVLGTYYPLALGSVNDGLTKLQLNVTTDPNGQPDLDTNKDTTATGIVMQTRNSLAFGGVGKSLYPGHRCTGYAKTGDPNSGLNEKPNETSVENTCAGADVLNIALFASAKIEDGVSTTLLEGISEKLLEGVGSFSVGCDPTKTLACAAGTLAAGGVKLEAGVNGPNGLAFGTNALAEGLPQAVEGAGQIKTKAADPLQQKGNDGSKQAGVAIATLDALQARADTGAGIPGGAPEGVTSYGGVYAFALDGAGGTATENAARAGLGFLALIAAGGIGAVLGNRATG
jgi:putative membrane protein